MTQLRTQESLDLEKRLTKRIDGLLWHSALLTVVVVMIAWRVVS